MQTVLCSGLRRCQAGTSHLPCQGLVTRMAPVRGHRVVCFSTKAQQPTVGWVSRAVRFAGAAAIATGVFVTAVPYILSTRWGLNAGLAMVNTALPARVEVSEAHLGWTRPLALHGLRIYDVPSRGSQLLLEIDQVSSTGSLWQALMMPSGNTELVINQPQVNCVWDKERDDLALVACLEDSGVMDAPKLLSLPTSSSSSSLSSHGRTEGGQQHVPASSDPATAAASAARSSNSASSGSVAAPTSTSKQTAGRSAEGGKPSLLDILCRVDSSMGFTADFKLHGSNVAVSDGKLLVPHEVRAVVGPHLHLTGALGRQQLADWGEELQDADVAWAVAQPEHVASRPGHHEPGIMQVHTDHLRLETRLWKGPHSTLLLHQPATAELDFTPQLASFGLSLVNPLLKDAAELRGGSATPRLAATFSPEGLQLPYSKAEIHIEPLQLTLGSSSLAAQVLRGVGLEPPGGGSTRGLQAWVSAQDVSITKGGPITTHRVDMLLGASGAAQGPRPHSPNGLHLVLWGSCDPATDHLAMSLGLPAPTLARLRLTHLPPDYVLPIALRGTPQRPQVDLGQATARLAQLVLRERVLAADVAAGSGGSTGRRQQEVDGAGALGTAEADSSNGAGGQQHGGGRGWRSWLGMAARLVASEVLQQVGGIEEAMEADMAATPPLRQPLPWVSATAEA